MISYLPFFSLIAAYFYAVAATAISRTGSNFWYFSFLFYLVAFSGFRYGVGTDYWTYVEFIDDIRKGSETYMEPGFELIAFLLDSPRLVFLVSSLLTITSFGLYFYFFSPYVGISVGLFFLLPIFFVASFNGVRQFIAVGFFLVALKAISNRNILVYIFLLIMGALFHKSALLLFPLYYVLSKKLNVVVLGGALLVAVLFVELLPMLTSFLGFSDKYFKGQFAVQSINYKSLVVLPIYIAALFAYSKIDSAPEVKNIFVNMMGISSILVLVPLLTDIHSSIVLRFSTYFTPALLVIVPMLIRVVPGNFARAAMTVLLFIASLYYYLTVIIVGGEYYSLIPYCTDFLAGSEAKCFQ